MRGAKFTFLLVGLRVQLLKKHSLLSIHCYMAAHILLLIHLCHLSISSRGPSSASGEMRRCAASLGGFACQQQRLHHKATRYGDIDSFDIDIELASMRKCDIILAQKTLAAREIKEQSKVGVLILELKLMIIKTVLRRIATESS